MQAARAETQPACSDGTGQLPSCGALAFPYVAVQGKDPVRYDDRRLCGRAPCSPAWICRFTRSCAPAFHRWTARCWS